METKEFQPNKSNIAFRKNIVPYGNVKLGSISTSINTPLHFKRAGAEEIKSEGQYTFNKSIKEYHKTEHFTIKISNIPTDISRRHLEDIIIEKCNIPIINIVFPYNREINQNKGYAFLTFQTKEKAKIVASKIDNYQIGCQLLMVEDARKQF